MSEEFVISAAHCFHQRDQSHLQVVIGIDNLGQYKTALIRNITKIHMMPNYRYDEFYYDLALVQMEKIDFGNTSRPICLPRQPDDNVDKRVQRPVTFAGWGYLSKNTASSNLVSTNLTIFSQLECNETHSGDNIRFKVNQKLPRRFQESVLCADFKGGPRAGICNGDSGGPLFVRNYVSGGVYQSILIGIASGVVDASCGNPAIPDIFNRIEASETLAWIKEVIFKAGKISFYIVVVFLLSYLLPTAWSEWTEYSACSQRCGLGYKTRRRQCSTGDFNDCVGVDVQSLACNEGPCGEHQKNRKTKYRNESFLYL